ncbi:recombination endonuclease subunit [Sinorhizobium phage phiM7]|uniref:Recombination endonuclease subunit n=2 Tax=Emdodecavirus TaxID=1980937 RepID=S5MAP1_9CAUD|nr:SbcD-like subunit of palindrome specific endonuclease [Sinorhizobium phage phiM12]YP_009601157.1 SbcD-like subunit of palindrome specific endonuclease [Sinorhizobium phage phiM7]AGR47678.1 recombination endonuclease subunit [Sinorhizobium phage phiM12]AKF12580.1 recombination endonuclease subunit [Sinorhizobium phage phiM7]AKF12940.1 recombination endonuclease subunit [Sinorhizobium phage phiM19]
MTKVAIITDTHFGARNDGQDFLDNQRRFYREFFFPELEKQKVTHVLHGGDLVDRRKYINFRTADQMDDMFMNRLAEGGYETHIILGNHDVFFRDTNQINALNILYGGVQGDRLKLYWNGPQTVEINGLDFLLCPWISDENRDLSMKTLSESSAAVVLGHFEISGFEMTPGSLCTHGIDKNVFSKYEAVWSGHFHHPSEYANIKYLGSPSETSWGDYNGKRGFHIFDTETRELKFYQNPFRMFHKIYYDDTEMTIDDIQSLDLEVVRSKALKLMVRRKNNPYIFDILLDRLAEAGALDVKIIDETMRIVHDEAQIIDEAEDTPTIMKKYVESIEVKADKSRVNELLQSLYKETFQ